MGNAAGSLPYAIGKQVSTVNDGWAMMEGKDKVGVARQKEGKWEWLDQLDNGNLDATGRTFDSSKYTKRLALRWGEA